MAPNAAARAARGNVANRIEDGGVVTDPNDAATINANNGSGDTQVSPIEGGDAAKLLAGLGFSPDAFDNVVITKANIQDHVAGRGKASKLDPRDAKMILGIIPQVTAEDFEVDNFIGYITFALHEDFLNKKKQIQAFIDKMTPKGFKVTAKFDCHEASPVKHGVSKEDAAENKGKTVIYNVTLHLTERPKNEA